MCVCVSVFFIKGVQILKQAIISSELRPWGGSSEWKSARQSARETDAHWVWKVMSCFLAIDSMGLDSTTEGWSVSTPHMFRGVCALQLFSYWPYYPATVISWAHTRLRVFLMCRTFLCFILNHFCFTYSSFLCHLMLTGHLHFSRMYNVHILITGPG